MQEYKPRPTQQDHDTAALRRQVAGPFRADDDEARSLATRAFGPGWKPAGRHCLVDHDGEERGRHCGDRTHPAATAPVPEQGEGHSP